MAQIFRCDWCGEIFDRQAISIQHPKIKNNIFRFGWCDGNQNTKIFDKHICPKCLMEALKKSLDENPNKE